MRFGLGPPVGSRRRRHSSLSAATVINFIRSTHCPPRTSPRTSSAADDEVFCRADREPASRGADVDALAVIGARRPGVVAPATIPGQTTGRTVGPRTVPAIIGPLVPGGVRRFGPSRPKGICRPMAPAQNMDNGSDCTVGDICEHVPTGNDVIIGLTSRRSSDVMLPSSFCMRSSPFCCCCCCC